MLKPRAGSKMSMHMAARTRIAVIMFGATALLGGCSETLSFVRLPDLTKLPEKVLNKDETKSKVDEMIEQGQTHQAEAAKEIEKGK